jgi:hypothetical protein
MPRPAGPIKKGRNELRTSRARGRNLACAPGGTSMKSGFSDEARRRHTVATKAGRRVGFDHNKSRDVVPS